ncbi:MAG: hypothetical protein FJ267_10420 [Planctomycetes bacterium]|nr:hypothetical protein [Planctomycetota bacterium]
MPRDLLRAASSNHRLTMIFSTGDPGYSLLMDRARRSVLQLIDNNQLTIQTIDHADHTFSRHRAQMRLVRLLVNCLSESNR